MTMEVSVGHVYRHFKGGIYKVLCIAKHTENDEQLVIYQDINDDSKVYARPYEMFVSKVDKDKYPEVREEYRFEEFNSDNLQNNEDKLNEFLDASDVGEKIRILMSMKKTVTDKMLDIMAFSIDKSLSNGDTDQKFMELYDYLLFRDKIEGGRLRR